MHGRTKAMETSMQSTDQQMRDAFTVIYCTYVQGDFVGDSAGYGTNSTAFRQSPIIFRIEASPNEDARPATYSQRRHVHRAPLTQQRGRSRSQALCVTTHGAALDAAVRLLWHSAARSQH